MTKQREGREFKALLEQRNRSGEQTCERLLQAIDRFEHGQLIRLPQGSKLTVRNLATEAEVSKDTPLSKYRKGDPKEGKYRFPGVVTRFNALKMKLCNGLTPENAKDRKISELREVIKELEEKFVLTNRVNNKLDAELYEKNRYIRELEEETSRLRRENLRVLPSVKKSGK